MQNVALKTDSTVNHTAVSNAINDFYALLSQGQKLTEHIKTVMTNHFGNDANGNWDRRMAYDLCESALTRFIHNYGTAIIYNAKADHEIIIDMLGRLEALMPTEYVRSEEQIELQQFSTPITVAYCAYLAAQLESGDVVIEPSAGTGMLAALPQATGHKVMVNEIGDFRSECLKTLYDTVYNQDAKYLADLETNARGNVVIMNPPFARDGDGQSTTTMTRHIDEALALLPEGGRLVVITGSGFRPSNRKFTKYFESLKTKATVVYKGLLPSGSFEKSGTRVDTMITVIDKTTADVKRMTATQFDTIVEFANAMENHVPKRGEIVEELSTPTQDNFTDFLLGGKSTHDGKPTPAPKTETTIETPAISHNDIVDITYTCNPPVMNTEEDGMYQEYMPQVITIDGAKAHPSPLVQSVAMASVAPPACTYVPKTYAKVIEDGLLSAAQLETVIYAGEQHNRTISGKRTVSECGLKTHLSEDPDAKSYRKGYFLGDGTGCGKGRQVAGVILDNFLNGRTKAIWVSKSDKLFEDAIRDWTAVGGKKEQIFSQMKIKKAEDIRQTSGILFTTYSTLRGAETQGKQSRLQQIMKWVGDDFDGVIVFDESHAMANAVSTKGERGVKKSSQQGIVGLKLQNFLPDARILYVSATGATELNNLAYADRLGLWTTKEFPFTSREDFISKMNKGGIASLEIISRDLKALGLYTARSLSYAGVEVDLLTHNLTPEQTTIYDTYAKAYKQIHQNLEHALEATKMTINGESANKGGTSTVKSAFESNKQRFFAHLLTAMKCPTMFTAIDDDLENDKSVVIQMVSTGNAMLERRLMAIPKHEWQDLQVDLTPREYIMDYLENAFPTVLHRVFVDEEGEERSEPMYDNNGDLVHNQEAIAMRDNMLELVCSLPPVESALDQIIKHYGVEMVAEVTGRGRRVVKTDEGKIAVQNRSASANIHETQAFMDGNKRILVFSDAGGTGRSYHADMNAKNQQQRIHYLLEPGWKADNAVQGLGRTNRTNQASAPVFRPITTDVKGERRFISTIAKRLDGLGAITRGQRQTGGQGMFKSEDNLETDYARQAMRFLMRDIYEGQAEISMIEFIEMTALKLTDKDGSILENLPPITQVLNRILALPISAQNMLFDIFNKYLDGVIEAAKANGTYEEGVKMMKAESFTIVERDDIYNHETSSQTTQCLTIKRVDKVAFTNPDAIIERHGAMAQFAYNTHSENVAIITPTSHITTANGEVRERVAIHRVASTERMDIVEYGKSSWQDIDPDRFWELWKQQKANTSPVAESTFKMITGLLLPIWNALPSETMTIQRLMTDDGEVVLGRLVNNEGLQMLYDKMDIERDVPFNLDEALVDVQKGSTIQFSNGYFVKKSFVNGQNRFEVIGTQPDVMATLKQRGCFTEIIQYRTRLFIPENSLAEVLNYLNEIS